MHTTTKNEKTTGTFNTNIEEIKQQDYQSRGTAVNAYPHVGDVLFTAYVLRKRKGNKKQRFPNIVQGQWNHTALAGGFNATDSNVKFFWRPSGSIIHHQNVRRGIGRPLERTHYPWRSPQRWHWRYTSYSTQIPPHHESWSPRTVSPSQRRKTSAATLPLSQLLLPHSLRKMSTKITIYIYIFINCKIDWILNINI